MTTDYASLDEAIVKEIRVVPLYIMQISGRIPQATDRQILGRLQSLRKRGIIEYNNGRWSAVEKE